MGHNEHGNLTCAGSTKLRGSMLGWTREAAKGDRIAGESGACEEIEYIA
jgi:hypothetical protein